MSTVILNKNKVNIKIVSLSLTIIICNMIPSKIYNLYMYYGVEKGS